MMYGFKLLPEALRAAAFAVIVFAAALAVDLDLDAITSGWQAYVRSVVPGLGAAIGAAALAVLTRKRA